MDKNLRLNLLVGVGATSLYAIALAGIVSDSGQTLIQKSYEAARASYERIEPSLCEVQSALEFSLMITSGTWNPNWESHRNSVE